MNRRSLQLFALLSMATLPLGTVACTKSSPTEPAFDEEALLSSASAAGSATDAATGGDGGLTSVTDEARGRGRGGRRNNDDQAGGNRGRRGRGGRGADDQPGDDRGGRGRGQDDAGQAQQGLEFEGAVARVGNSAIFLTGGTRIVVDGQTQWIARGDLHSLDQVAGAVAANRPTRVEGRGTRQADGSILAATLKAEVDD